MNEETWWTVQNTTQPIRDFKHCHCHRWRIDECPNVGIALWAKQQRDLSARS